MASLTDDIELVRRMSGTTFESLRALVVEDNVHMRALLRSLLLTLGIRDVLEASDGQEALTIVHDENPDLILTDLSMKPKDGLAFTREVRMSDNSPNPYVPIIMVTAHTERHRVESSRDCGVTEFLAKPITTQNLFLRIKEIVERPRPFIRSNDYFGPDRRRRIEKDYKGPWRRKADTGMKLEIK